VKAGERQLGNRPGGRELRTRRKMPRDQARDRWETRGDIAGRPGERQLGDQVRESWDQEKDAESPGKRQVRHAPYGRQVRDKEEESWGKRRKVLGRPDERQLRYPVPGGRQLDTRRDSIETSAGRPDERQLGDER
jgi:hypothetical protein